MVGKVNKVARKKTTDIKILDSVEDQNQINELKDEDLQSSVNLENQLSILHLNSTLNNP
eukprot:CAMPEP_0170498446 /NCGR_PEP_ID=MMETSP0208-20121228/27837_1 /TAXON_ID=197538 /ORGANISM="Strombidium inclinatum, Strain S3" /LENGTH=58 /DNA_ID=CAMNT_0010775617 /DNA_START=1149 /DNA_END=1325 /DNA_ORIENTATION=+